MSERAIFQCTSTTPWNKATHIPGTQVEHDTTRQVGEQEDGWPGGDYITIECANCGHRWKQELPQ